MRAPRIRTFAALPEPVGFLLTVVGIPVVCACLLSVILLYVLGGTDLLRFAVTQLTWKLAFRILCGIVALASVTWARHVFWYSDERPPMWLRKSLWVNVLETFILLGVVAFGIWALQKF